VKKLFRSNPLYFAFLLPAVVDGIVTLIGQDGAYWLQPHMATDASPAYYFLSVSPWIFIFGSVVWFIFWYWLFLRINDFTKYFFVFLFVAGHSWGSSSWIIKILKQGVWYEAGDQVVAMMIWSVLIAYYVVIALVAAFVLRHHVDLNK